MEALSDAELADAQLVRRCLAGDQATCARLVSRHARMAGTVIWRAVRNRELVEDLCQETFLRGAGLAACASVAAWLAGELLYAGLLTAAVQPDAGLLAWGVAAGSLALAWALVRRAPGPRITS